MSSLFNLILWEIIIEISSVVRGSKQIWPPIWIKQICSLVWINFLPKSFASSHNRGNFYNYFHSIELKNDNIFPAKVPPSSCCPVLSCFSAHVSMSIPDVDCQKSPCIYYHSKLIFHSSLNLKPGWMHRCSEWGSWSGCTPRKLARLRGRQTWLLKKEWLKLFYI